MLDAPLDPMNSDIHILIVDDDSKLRSLVREYLVDHQFMVSEADGGASMRAVLETAAINVIVLDVMMPGEDGLSIARSLSHRQDLSVIMVSALGSETDRIIGLEVGADDYLAKPISPRELVARIRAVRRRQTAPGDSVDAKGVFEFESWRFDIIRRVLRDPTGLVITLSEGEFALLRTFIERPQRVLTRDQLLEYARGPHSEAFDRAIDTQVSRLRKKLSGRASQELIRTVRSEGYMFLPKVSQA